MVLQNFIVLGIIPGTNMQINFQLWLAAILTVTVAWQARRMLHSYIFAALMIKRSVGKIALTQAGINDIAL